MTPIFAVMLRARRSLISRRGFLVHLRIVESEHRDGGAHHVHRVRGLRRGFDEIDDAAGQFALGAQLLA